MFANILKCFKLTLNLYYTFIFVVQQWKEKTTTNKIETKSDLGNPTKSK